MSEILSVSQVTQKIKHVLNQGIPYVWVQGELTNLARPNSGHLYFSLKDSQAQLPAVWFKQHHVKTQKFDPLTGEVYEDKDLALLNPAPLLTVGMQVICAGQLGVYGPSGVYQLLVEYVQVQGDGQLAIAFAALRQQLMAEGFFRLERKRPLPKHPQKISVLTSLSGAVIHDFINLASPRGTGFSLCIQPIPVQGDEAPQKIAAAIALENERAWAEVIVLIRGGGSMQDLQAFNTESVARAIFNSKIPVVAGIGHEVDTSLADLTADVRAATPSHAASLLWPERQWYLQFVDDLDLKLQHNLQAQLNTASLRLDKLQARLQFQSPRQKLGQLHLMLDALNAKLQHNLQTQLNTASLRLDKLQTRLQLQSVQQKLGPVQLQFTQVQLRLAQTIKTQLQTHESALTNLQQRLNAIHAPLRKGYSFTTDAKGQVVSSIKQLKTGQSLHLHWVDGQAEVQVLKLSSITE